MQKLIEVYKHFRAEVFPRRKEEFHRLADSQSPEILFITCSDSRVVPSLIFQTGPGDMFLCRNAGNVVPPAGERAGGVSATIEYAVRVLRVRHAIVCGHSDCGAVRAAMEPQRLKQLPLVEPWMRLVEKAQWIAGDIVAASGEDHDKEIRRRVCANIVGQIANLKTQSAVAEGLAARTLQVHGWYYDIFSGAVEAFVPEERRFVPLEHPSMASKPTQAKKIASAI
jgi:carbonic anhydrase